MNSFSTTKILQVVQGRDTYKPDGVYILHYGEQRGSLNKISFKELHFWGWFCFRPSLAQLSASPPVGMSSSPHLQHSMMPICEFGGTLTVAGKSFKDIQQIIKDIYGDKDIKRMQIYDILEKVKEGKSAADQ
jgi:hypothetical protein